MSSLLSGLLRLPQPQALMSLTSLTPAPFDEKYVGSGLPKSAWKTVPSSVGVVAVLAGWADGGQPAWPDGVSNTHDQSYGGGLAVS